MATNPTKVTDRTAMAALATKLRSRKSRHRDPNVVALTSTDSIAAGDRALRLTRTLARAKGERPVAGMTSAEAAAIDRIAAEQGISQ